MYKKRMYLIFVLQLWIIFGFLMTTPIQSSKPIQEEHYTSLKLSTSPSKECVRVVGEFRVNSYTASDQTDPVICRLSDDKFAVAWMDDARDGSGYGVYTCVINATTGKKLTPEVRANNYTNGFQGYPAICAISNDTYAVAWTSSGQDYSTTSGIYARVFDATTGNNITDEFRANHVTTDDQEKPSICCTPEGRLIIVWESDHRVGKFEIFARLFNVTTVKNITEEILVNIGVDIGEYNPSVCALPNEVFAVVWESNRNIVSYEIMRKIYNATTGLGMDLPRKVNEYQDSWQVRPSVCAADDTYAATWSSFGQDGSQNGVYAKIFESSNPFFSITTETRMNQEISQSQQDSSICAFSNDYYAVAWESENQDTSGYGIYAIVFKAQSGSLVTSEFRVNPNITNEQRNPSICGLSDTEFAVVWESNHEGQYDIYGTVFRIRNISPLVEPDDDDDDNGGGDKESIFGYDIIAIIAIIGCVVVVLIKKWHKQIK